MENDSRCLEQRVGFVFPGQGSQKQGMLADLAAVYPSVQATFDEASSVLGYDLWQLAQSGSQASLNLTESTQPLLLTASVAIWRVWRQASEVSPDFLAGHSLGEWSALVCSGVVGFTDAVRAVQLRGKYMQEAVPEGVGAMAAIIGLDDHAIKAICVDVAQHEMVSAVNFNSPGQVVIAGHVAAVERACLACQQAGAKRAMRLPVSAPFHSPLLRPAADQLSAHLSGVAFAKPAIPIVHNVHASFESDPVAIKRVMVEQIDHPVLWVACVDTLLRAGVTTFVECGPGKVLSGLIKRINRGATLLSTDTPGDMASALAAVNPMPVA